MAVLPDSAGVGSNGATPVMGTSTELQTVLKNLGYYNGAIDGKVGAKTLAAIKNFQTTNGLTVDGKAGRDTWSIINSGIAKGYVAPKTTTKATATKSTANYFKAPSTNINDYLPKGSSSAPAAPSTSSYEALKAQLLPKVSMDAMLAQARTMLGAAQTQDRQGYQSALNQLDATYKNSQAGINNQYAADQKTLTDAQTAAYDTNKQSANSRGVFWGNAVNQLNDRTNKATIDQLGNLTTQKTNALNSVGITYDANQTDLNSKLSALAGLYEQKAAGMAPDLYNSEYTRQLQGNQFVQQTADTQWTQQFNQWKANQDIAMQKASLAAQQAMSAASIAAENARSSASLNFQKQQYADSKGAATDASYQQLYQLIGNNALKLTAPNSTKGLAPWNSAYSDINNYIKALPASQQAGANNYLKNNSFYTDYAKFTAPNYFASKNAYANNGQSTYMPDYMYGA